MLKSKWVTLGHNNDIIYSTFPYHLSYKVVNFLKEICPLHESSKATIKVEKKN